ncbi:hypothetical protein [Phyllobacterium endophyticum]|nr:hypothetical protein [Phyllobacterium endophyticum]MBB3233167.1 hypothetical protein [Phyllobacterium endophyticum]TXR49722.1 hypothetical protein FVA77_08770 [Phyllobacterium endophyticum]TYR43192.1 hypothetical protein FY050_05410 [Phyllobacterium endophyticum]
MNFGRTTWIGLLSAAGVVAMFLDFATFTSEDDAGVDIRTTASVATEKQSLEAPRFVISSLGDGTSCKAFPMENGTPGHNGLSIETSCRDLYSPLANAKTWHNNKDGTIDLADFRGQTIVEFSPSDGLSYISVEPRTVVLSMSAEGIDPL